MLVLVAHYTFFFWLFVGGNNAEKLILEQIVEADEDLFYLTACTSRCLYSPLHSKVHYGLNGKEQSKYYQKHHQQQEVQNSTLKQCFQQCNLNRSGNENLQRIQENFRFELLCRDDLSLTFRIDRMWAEKKTSRIFHNKTVGIGRDHKHLLLSQISQVGNVTSMKKIGNSAQKDAVDDEDAKDFLYFIRINNATNAEHFWVYLSDEEIITINNLKQNSTYNITAVAVNSNNRYSIITKMQQFQTLQRGYTPGLIAAIEVLNYRVMPEALPEIRLSAVVKWKPSKDMTCHYNIILFSTESFDLDVAPFEIREPHQLYSFHIKNLTFDKEYKVGIRSKNTHNELKESALFWYKFHSPTCVEFFNYNFQKCPPPVPEGLKVEKTYIRKNVLTLNISWQLPQHLPDYYELKVLDLTSEGLSYERNVSKYWNNYTFEEITLRGFVYEVFLIAHSAGGTSSAVYTDGTQVHVVVPDKNHRIKLISAIFAPIFCVVLLALTTFIVCHRRAKLKRYQERCKYFEELEKKAPIDPKATFDISTKSLQRLTTAEDLKQFQMDLEEKIFFNDDSMEIERNDVTIYELLGEGAFGLVRRGVYYNSKSGEKREVAVKMLKEQPSIDDIHAFRHEIEVMKSVEQHPNIIGLIGHCTKRFNEMLLLTEYCSLGNLLDFLRDEWKYLHELQLNTMMTRIIKMPESNESNFSNNYNSTETEEKNFDGYQNNNNNKNNNLTIKSNVNGKLAAFNKSYGYDEICTNSCKCQVDIVPHKNFNIFVNSMSDANNSMKILILQTANNNKIDNKINKIAIKDCECRQLKQQQEKLVSNNQRNALEEMELTKQIQFSVENKVYYKCDEDQKFQQLSNTQMALQREPLKTADLMDIARQVATGMEFLAKNKVVHRDLAARNILVAADRTIKIADFGLSRDIYQENIYKKTGNGKLPIKWLALESMTHQVYTTPSDVWSFGILLYEIATLGGTPYPAIPTNRLLHMLKTGYRMEKPKNCGQEFYDLMASCWHANPSERPTFTKIIEKLDEFMSEDMNEQQQVEANILTIKSASREDSKLADAVIDDAYLNPL